MEEKIIFPDSPEAATYKANIEGWVSSTGHFFGKGQGAEQAARYKGSTHARCDCGGAAKHPYTACEDCRHKNRIKRYNELPFKEWDKQEPVCLYDGDEYFFSEEDLAEYLVEREMNGSDIMLVICEPIEFSVIDYETIAPAVHEDWEPNAKLVNLVKDFNNSLRQLSTNTWMPGKTRTSYEYSYTPE